MLELLRFISYLLTLYKNNVVENAVAVTPSTNDPAGFAEKVKASLN